MRALVLGLAVIGTAASVSAQASPTYALVKSVPLGTPDRWDYVVYDDHTQRIYVAHADRLAVVDARTGNLVGEVEGISGGTHGTAISAATRQGFTDDGRNGKAVAFDLDTLKITKEIPADVDADAIASDRATGHIFIIEGDPAAVTVIDPKTDAPVATIKAGEKLEYGEGDGHGSIYVAGVATGNLLKFDARTNRLVARWPTTGCSGPHGLAVDPKTSRVFMGCANAMMVVVDGKTGRQVASLPIGHGNDAVAFDPVRKRVFSSNGRDGTITVYQEVTPDHYVPLPTVQSQVSGRTMSVDPENGWLFVAAGDIDPAPTPNGRPKIKPGTAKLLIFEPRG